MKIGSCLLMLATKEDPLAEKSIPLIKEAGYDYAEVPLARLWPLSASELARYHGLFMQNELPVEVFNNSIPDGLIMVGPDVDKAAQQAFILRAVEIAKSMGVRMITMCGPSRSCVPVDFSWKTGVLQYVEFLKGYAEVAAKEDITLVIEPINDEENSFIATVREAIQVVRACGRKNVKAMVDFYHFFKQEDDWNQLLLGCNEDIVHVHYATRVARAYPLKTDVEECKAALCPVLAAGYHGRISIEAKTTCPKTDLYETCTLFRELFV